MRSIIVAVVASVALLGWLSQAWAQAESGGPFRVLSNGVDTCGQYVRASADEKVVYDAWALGFISGANSEAVGRRREIGERWEPDSVRVWLLNFCQANPLVTFVRAAMQLREALAQQQGLDSR